MEISFNKPCDNGVKCHHFLDINHIYGGDLRVVPASSSEQIFFNDIVNTY
jgi:hypothetical protein